MTRNLKFFIFPLFFTIIIFLGINILFGKTEKAPSFTAQIVETSPLRKINIQPNLSAQSAIVMEVDKKGNDIVHFEKGIKQKLPIASLTKLMTALVVFENPLIYPKSMPITLSKKAVSQIDASRYITLEEGKTFSLETLLNILLIESGNGAAQIIAETLGEKEFINTMNFKAKELNMLDTFFVNPSGLDNRDNYNYSTVYDLAVLAQYIKKNYPEIFHISSKEIYHVFDINNEFYYFIPENTNKLLFEIPEIIGGKTGWTPTAGQCLLVLFSHPHKDTYFISVVLNSQNRFEDIKNIIQQIYNDN
ncbi:MAG: hypothetical protein PHN37_00090 [Candidatus Pacebacteria bacterium]|nr:hypothetical protein [Candidatus Paceibacterota bacterium]